MDENVPVSSLLGPTQQDSSTSVPSIENQDVETHLTDSGTSNVQDGDLGSNLWRQDHEDRVEQERSQITNAHSHSDSQNTDLTRVNETGSNSDSNSSSRRKRSTDQFKWLLQRTSQCDGPECGVGIR